MNYDPYRLNKPQVPSGTSGVPQVPQNHQRQPVTPVPQAGYAQPQTKQTQVKQPGQATENLAPANIVPFNPTEHDGPIGFGLLNPDRKPPGEEGEPEKKKNPWLLPIMIGGGFGLVMIIAAVAFVFLNPKPAAEITAQNFLTAVKSDQCDVASQYIANDLVRENMCKDIDIFDQKIKAEIESNDYQVSGSKKISETEYEVIVKSKTNTAKKMTVIAKDGQWLVKL